MIKINMIKINWEEAPDWANGHYLCNDDTTRYWLKGEHPNTLYKYRRVGSDRTHMRSPLHYLMNASNNWEKQFTPRPEKVEGKGMELKEFKKTLAYEQLRKFIEVNVPDVGKRPAQLGIMVKRAMTRINPVHWNHGNSTKDLNWLCSWGDTPEGWGFWNSVLLAHKVDNINPCPIGKRKEAKKPAVKKEEKPVRVGWW